MCTVAVRNSYISYLVEIGRYLNEIESYLMEIRCHFHGVTSGGQKSLFVKGK